MYIESLELKNFRNYESLSLPLEKGKNLFFGDNAQGKTNLLEAIYLCATTKSHRGSKDREMIRFDQEDSHIRLILSKRGIRHKIDLHLKRSKSKGAAIDGLPIRRASELFGLLNVVFFSPEDLNIIKAGPAERRTFLNREVCQLSEVYLQILLSYNKVIAQRNALLKEISSRDSLKETLDVWDDQLVYYGKKLIRERERFLNRMNEEIRDLHRSLTGGREKLMLTYEPDVTAEEFDRKLKKERNRDIKYRLSTVGPHRDDFKVSANGIDLRHFGSQGQQRSAALSLKRAEINLMKALTGETPVLLLDDVLSELDHNRQKDLIGSLEDTQTFITCTGVENILQTQFENQKIFEVTDGKVESRIGFF